LPSRFLVETPVKRRVPAGLKMQSVVLKRLLRPVKLATGPELNLRTSHTEGTVRRCGTVRYVSIRKPIARARDRLVRTLESIIATTSCEQLVVGRESSTRNLGSSRECVAIKLDTVRRYQYSYGPL